MKKLWAKRYAIIAAVGIAYLCLANYYIYHMIGAEGLKPSDKQYAYTLGDGAATSPALNYVALGDSFTSGTGVESYEDSYPYQVAQLLAGEQTVTLRDFSIPGARTSKLIDDLLAPAIASDPDVVTVLIGTNDIHGRVSRDEFEKNYRFIIESLQQKTHARIYLVSIPFNISDRLIFPPFNYYFRQQTADFNSVIRRLAGEYGVGYVDIATPTREMLSGSGPYYAADHFHLSASGYKLWAQIIYDYIH